MHIAHIGIWTTDIEAMKDFYTHYFDGKSNKKYTNPTTTFESYFISFEQGTQLELMYKPSVSTPLTTAEYIGIAHIGFKLGSPEAVLVLTNRLRMDGYQVMGEPRTTGDGYFESVVLDPEGNHIELIA